MEAAHVGSVRLEASFGTVQSPLSYTLEYTFWLWDRKDFDPVNISLQFYFQGLHLSLLLQVAVHYEGKFYEFVPWEGKVEWEIAPWGSWKMTAQTKTHEVRVV